MKREKPPSVMTPYICICRHTHSSPDPEKTMATVELQQGEPSIIINDPPDSLPPAHFRIDIRINFASDPAIHVVRVPRTKFTDSLVLVFPEIRVDVYFWGGGWLGQFRFFVSRFVLRGQWSIYIYT